MKRSPRSLDAVELLGPVNRGIAVSGASIGIRFFGLGQRSLGIRVGGALSLRDRAGSRLAMQIGTDPLRRGRTALRARRDVRDLPFELGYLLRAWTALCSPGPLFQPAPSR